MNYKFLFAALLCTYSILSSHLFASKYEEGEGEGERERTIRTQTAYIDTLSDDTLGEIFQYLDASSLLHAAVTHRRWYFIIFNLVSSRYRGLQLHEHSRESIDMNIIAIMGGNVTKLLLNFLRFPLCVYSHPMAIDQEKQNKLLLLSGQMPEEINPLLRVAIGGAILLPFFNNAESQYLLRVINLFSYAGEERLRLIAKCLYTIFPHEDKFDAPKAKNAGLWTPELMDIVRLKFAIANNREFIPVAVGMAEDKNIRNNSKANFIKYLCDIQFEGLQIIVNYLGDLLYMKNKDLYDCIDEIPSTLNALCTIPPDLQYIFADMMPEMRRQAMIDFSEISPKSRALIIKNHDIFFSQVKTQLKLSLICRYFKAIDYDRIRKIVKKIRKINNIINEDIGGDIRFDIVRTSSGIMTNRTADFGPFFI